MMPQTASVNIIFCIALFIVVFLLTYSRQLTRPEYRFMPINTG